MLITKHSIIASLLLSCLTQAVLAEKTIMESLAENERFGTLIKHIQRLRLEEYMNKIEHGTLFAPENDAFEKCEFEIENSTLLYHLTKKGIISGDFYDGQLKETLYIRSDTDSTVNNGDLVDTYASNVGQRIKITKDGKKVYVNQAKVVTTDIQVNNETYIQVIDRVLQPLHPLGDMVSERNRAIYNLMQNTKETIPLLQSNQPFTIILSTRKDSLEKFNPIEMEYMRSEYGRKDLSFFFNYTIIDKAIYLDEFTSGKTTYKSLSGDSLSIEYSKDKKPTVNEIPIIQYDILAANGVIHEVDETFKPESITFNTRKYLYGSNATHMVELFDKYQLNQYIDQTEFNYTFLVPPPITKNTNDAISPNITISKAWLEYHIINGSWSQENLIDNMLLETEFKSHDLGNRYQKLPVYVDSSVKSSNIQFDHSRVIAESVNIHDDMIYQISEPLSLPGDVLGKLVVDLDLSTFIATLYVSEVVDEIKETQGVTLFVPTNDAFKNLGLVAKYLVHPTAKSQLKAVLRYHAAKSLLYYDDMKNKVHEVSTLANSTLRISQSESGSIIVGRPESNNGATLLAHPSNMLVSNGVVHKISEVQIPNQVTITNQNLLIGIESSTMMQILTEAKLLDKINEENMVVLAPSDKAFAHIDLDALFKDEYKLQRLAKLHIIPKQEWQDRWIASLNTKSPQSPPIHRDKTEYPTLLSKDDKVTIKESEKGELYIEVKNGGDGDRAHVTGLGRVTAGGGVIAIDAVLMPIRRGFFGLPLMWSVIVTLTIIILVGGLAGVVGFFGYKIYNRRRLGYRPIY